MATTVMEKLGRLFISLQQIRRAPQLLAGAAPSAPTTVQDAEVPRCFRERLISAGYRPPHQRWRYYFLSLFQRHNETVNAWSHLLAFAVFGAELGRLCETVDFAGDPHSWPLLVLLVSSMMYTAFSTAAHLLGSKSELWHFTLFFLDYVGVAQYQYGSAVAHYYYAADEELHGRVRGVFMPLAALFSCLSFVGCCCGKYCSDGRRPWVRKVGQVVPSAVAYLWDSSPVAKRLLQWSGTADDPAVVYHLGQVAFFCGCAVFFAFPVPERCFPGRCDFVGHSHQVFHVLLACCTFCQIRAAHLDYLGRRAMYARLHRADEAALFVCLYGVVLVVCAFVLLVALRKVKKRLEMKSKCM